MSLVPVQCLAEGDAEGLVALWRTPLSFWGGFDAATGRVIDRSHSAFGRVVTGPVLVMPSGRGSSSSSSVLAEAIRRGTAPAALILVEADPIIVVGAIVARKLYGRACSVVVYRAALSALQEGQRVRVAATEGGSTIELLA